MRKHNDLCGLEGRTLTGVRKSEDGERLVLSFDDGDETWEAEGDCCANAWVESINIMATLPAVLTGREERELDAQEVDHEVLDVCFYSLRTSTGHVDIELRVGHNGYYGGWLVHLDKP